MNSRPSSRRRFQRESAALAGWAAGATQIAIGQTAGSEAGEGRPKDLHAYGERSRFETSVRIGNNGRWAKYPLPGVPHYTGSRTPLQGSIGNITPAALHYMVSHSYEPPDLDSSKHRLEIDGMVDRPLFFTLEDLKRLPSVSRLHFIECRANGDPSRGERKAPTALFEQSWLRPIRNTRIVGLPTRK
jgi:sulfane dehydrogenase subunit SoxC